MSNTIRYQQSFSDFINVDPGNLPIVASTANEAINAVIKAYNQDYIVNKITFTGYSDPMDKSLTLTRGIVQSITFSAVEADTWFLGDFLITTVVESDVDNVPYGTFDPVNELWCSRHRGLGVAAYGVATNATYPSDFYYSVFFDLTFV